MTLLPARDAAAILRVIIAVLLALVIGFVVGVEVASSDKREPAPTPAAFRSFDLPEPSPARIVGLHEYQTPGRLPPAATPSPSPRPRATAAPRKTPHNDTLGGYATWHATGRDGLYAAAGPALRRALGRDWRGSVVLVCTVSSSRCVEVRLNDWCACGPRRGFDTLLDLSDEAFGYLAPLSRGVIRVAVDIP